MMRNGIPARDQRQRFLGAAPEDARVAALETQDALSSLGQVNEPGRDVGLARRGAATPLAGVVERRVRPRQAQDARIDERVVDDDVGIGERVQCQHGQKSGFPGAGADEPNLARLEVRQTKTRAVDQKTSPKAEGRKART